MPEFCLLLPPKPARATLKVDKNRDKCLNFVYRRHPNTFDITKLGNINLIREKMKEDGDYYCSEEEFRKFKKGAYLIDLAITNLKNIQYI